MYKDPGFRGFAGVVVSVGDKVTIVTKPGATREIGPKKLARAERVVDMSAIPSELFRLYAIADRTETWAQGVAAWLGVPGNAESLLPDVDSRRLFARSAFAAGRGDLARTTGLTDTELDWLAMHAAFSAGSYDRAASMAIHLPQGRFLPDRAMLLLSMIAHRDWTPGPPEIGAVSDWPTSQIGAKAVRAAIGLPLAMRDWDELVSWVKGGDSKADSRWLEFLIAGEPGQRLSVTDAGMVNQVAADGRTYAVEERAVAARFGGQLALEVDDLKSLAFTAPSMVDDLIDAGRLTLDGPTQGVPSDLLARIAPGELTAAQLQEVGHMREMARRAYASGAGDWPGGPADAHYQGLLALRSGDPSMVDQIEDETGVAIAVARSLEKGTPDELALIDPTTWDLLASGTDTSGAIASRPEAGPWYLRRSIDSLLAWDWDGAEKLARQSLRVSKEELVRDEALNVMAFVRFQRGEDEEAITALERALDGAYTAALQANAGIVAEQMDPEKAAYQLGRLASEAPNTDLKLAAARRAFRIWSTGRSAWEETDDLPDLPDQLLSATRELAQADIGIDDFVAVMRLSAIYDEEWLADAVNTQSSPHSESWERKVFVAKAGDNPGPYIEAVASGLKAGYEAEWLMLERDSVVDGLRSLIFDDIEHLGPAAYAFMALDKGLPMDDLNQVVLTCGATVSICRSLMSSEGIPSDQLVGMFTAARQKLNALDGEQRAQVAGLVDIAGNTLGMAIASGHEDQLQPAYEAMQQLSARLVGMPLNRINWAAVREACLPIRDMAAEAMGDLTKAKEYVASEDLRSVIDGVISNFENLRDLAANPRSMFT